jgi:hypothetical protein
MKTLKNLLVVGGIILLTINSQAQNLEIKINETLRNYSTELVKSFDKIPEERKQELREIGNYLSAQLQEQNNYSVLFVCTHNSRRSHMADTWFKYAMTFYGINQFESYSGGLEATTFNINAIAALERAGFTIVYNKKVVNPAVSITPGNYPVWRMKSKIYTHQINPKSNFTAIMVCSDADKSCPIVQGADQRFSLPFDDPRYFDNTPSQDLKYDETVAEIGREMFYLSDYIKSQIIIQLEAAK